MNNGMVHDHCAGNRRCARALVGDQRALDILELILAPNPVKMNSGVCRYLFLRTRTRVELD
jgi:hypothetical protein